MTDKILCVDDDPYTLEAYRSQLHKHFRIETAQGAEQGLRAIGDRGRFAVVVADMRMSSMDGIQFFTIAKRRDPDSIGIIFTTSTGLQPAVDAVNEGSIFRILIRPCPPETLARSIRAGLEQHQLITAEQKIADEIIASSIRVLTEILSLINPAAFSRTFRITSYVKDIITTLRIPNSRQIELAAMLSQIGCAALPPDILERIYNGKPLSLENWRVYSSHPSVGSRLLANIPYLEPITRMIEGQHEPFSGRIPTKNLTQEDMIALGSQILKVAIAFDQIIVGGRPHSSALSELRAQPEKYNPQIVNALERTRIYKAIIFEEARVEVGIGDLEVGMVICEDVKTPEGLLLVPKGQEVTQQVLEHLQNLSKTVGVKEPFLCYVEPAAVPASRASLPG